MRRLFILMMALTLFFFHCTSGGRKKADPGFRYFSIGVEQDGTAREIISNEVILAKKPFAVIVSLTGPDGIFVNASYDSETFTAALQGKSLEDLPGFEGTGIAEELFNPDGAIYIGKKSPNFWQYTDDANHRFNSIVKFSGGVSCARKILNVIDADKSNEKTDVSKLRENAFYLVFMSLEWNKDFSRRIEKKRTFLKIVFQKDR